MTSKNLNNWFMYHEIKKLSRLGFSDSRIARHLSMDRRTVSKYLLMEEVAFEKHLLSLESRQKSLAPYEDFVKEKLRLYPDTSAAQVFDWLKEHDKSLPEVSSRTVYNFVIYVRQKHNLPLEKMVRDYFPVEELPYGKQAQVDFGQYNMRTADGKRKKVHFFAMVLSRSRMKFVLFSTEPFTAHSVCCAHEAAFTFFNGIPVTIVYDQDRTMMVDENLGRIILASGFREYVRSRGFQTHFCRKADPESKGKIENVIRYIKINFLTNRTYSTLETLNQQALNWLARTANYLKHDVIKKSPMTEYDIEKSHLQPFSPLNIQAASVELAPTYLVRKNNVIHYKSNFYSVPQGTYSGPDIYVTVKENGKNIDIFHSNGQLIATHECSLEKGKTIINTNHKRNTSHSLAQMRESISGYFKDPAAISFYLENIRKCYPRYFRDHLELLSKTLKKSPDVAKDGVLAFCTKNKLYDAADFAEIAAVHSAPNPVNKPGLAVVKPMYSMGLDKALETPEKSNLDDYENIINP